MESRKHLTNHGNGGIESRITEEYPAETDKMKCQQYSKYFTDTGAAIMLGTMKQTAQKLMHSKCTP